jgi:hypothetical protein
MTSSVDPLITVAVLGAFVTLVAGLVTFLGSRSQVAFVERLQAEVTRLDGRVKDLERSDGEKDSRIMVLTTWGTYSIDPIPRTPPPWREAT